MANNATTLKGFYGFTRHPFPPSCPAEPLFRHGAVEAALDHAKNALLNRLHVLVTAPPGLGKSSFCRLLLTELNPRDLRAAYLVGQPIGPTEFLQKVSDVLGAESSFRRGKAAKLLTEGLQKLAGQGAHPVLILDEAQQVPLADIDLLRLIAEDLPAGASAQAGGSRTLLSLVLVGDDTLRRNLNRQAFVPLAGRLAVRLRIAPLTLEESNQFIEHAFTQVGMPNVLAQDTGAMVHAAAQGSPREIGAILLAAMRRGLQKRSKILTGEIVQEAIDERHQ